MRNLMLQILRDDSGGEVLEVALTLGLVVVGCLAIMGVLGTKFFNLWKAVEQAF